MNIVIFKNFSKRKNSTKRPALSTGTTLTAQLKEMTSVENPSFILRRTDNFESINYVYALNHYYTVSDTVILDNDRIELQCTQDLLATYRSNIYGYKGVFVSYASDNFSPALVDNRCVMYTPKTEVGTGVSFNNNILLDSYGGYLLTIIDGAGTGFTSTYYVTSTKLQTIANKMLNTDIGGWIEQFTLSTDNPLSAVVEIKDTPFNLEGQGIDKDIHIGLLDTSVRGVSIADNSTNRVKGNIEIPINWHYSDFRRKEPYTKLSLYIPYYSTIEIPTAPFIASTSITIKYCIDLLSGDIALTIGNSATDYRMNITYNVACNIPIAQLTSNAPTVVSDVVSMSGNILAGAGAIATGNVIGAIGSATGIGASAVNMFADAQTEIRSSKGSRQGKALEGFGNKFVLMQTYYETNEPLEYCKTIGLPVMDVKNISDFIGISGAYIKTDGASISIAGRTTDSEQINGLLDSGIFLE